MGWGGGDARGENRREKRENELCPAAASVLRYCVILEDTGKAIIKKHYGNFNFNVPVSVLTTLSLTFTDRHKWQLILVSSRFKWALRSILPTSSGARQTTAHHPQININTDPAGLSHSHPIGFMATILVKGQKKKKKKLLFSNVY